MEPEDPGEGGAGATSPPQEALGTAWLLARVCMGELTAAGNTVAQVPRPGDGWSCVGLCAPP